MHYLLSKPHECRICWGWHYILRWLCFLASSARSNLHRNNCACRWRATTPQNLFCMIDSKTICWNVWLTRTISRLLILASLQLFGCEFISFVCLFVCLFLFFCTNKNDQCFKRLHYERAVSHYNIDRCRLNSPGSGWGKERVHWRWQTEWPSYKKRHSFPAQRADRLAGVGCGLSLFCTKYVSVKLHKNGKRAPTSEHHQNFWPRPQIQFIRIASTMRTMWPCSVRSDEWRVSL